MSGQVFQEGPAGYAIGQLERAVEAAARAGDAAARAGAQDKVRRWRDVLDGMVSGQITIGSRTPVAHLPAWVTLEVAHGGFATGRALSEAAMSAAETEVLARLPREVPGETDRERLNLWYLGDAGQAELLRKLASGHCGIEVPEDAALAAVAVLLDRGFPEQALDLVAELRPFMARLRFTPAADSTDGPETGAVRVGSVGEVTAALRALSTPQQLTLMRATVDVWTPLYDRLVALWCATVDGELPRLDGSGAVQGGWPGRTWPEWWTDERACWLDDFAAARRAHEFRGRHAHRKSNFARLHEALVDCDTPGSGLTARRLGWVRRALANTITRHGEPDSAARESLRRAQVESLSAPSHADIATVVANRLGRYPADGGLPSVDPVTAPISAEEEAAIRPASVPEGSAIPPHLRDKVIRALEAPPEELIRRRVIGSGEVLAAVLPQLSSRTVAADFAEPDVAELIERVYTAFRRRRSLLLVNLRHQVRFEELPWVTALNPLRRNRNDTKARASAARVLLRRTVLSALESFPHAPLPNPLVREFGTLAERAELALPLVEEVAADIFMGTFTEKWRDAAVIASRALDGTLYAAYYDLPAPSAWNTRPRNVTRYGKRTAPDFTELCARRATEAGTAGSHVARNGALLEQSQILTTHNLAVLVAALDLDDTLRRAAPEAARRTFEWILRRLGQPADRHAALIQVKNTAYAWRQALFLLSYCDPAIQRAHVRRLAEQAAASRFAPAAAGLAHILDGGRFDETGVVPGGAGRRFLGWAAGRHWYFG